MFRRLWDFRVFKTLKLSQNAIYNRLSIPTVRRFTATSIGFVEPTRSIIHHRIQDYSTWTRTTTTEEVSLFYFISLNEEQEYLARLIDFLFLFFCE